MRVTTKSAYGVRSLINLALAYESKAPVSIKEMARKEDLSGIYLEQIFNRLKNQGVVKSVRGPKGGYILAKDPSQVTVYDVMRALEGDVSVGKCIPKTGSVCERAQKCAPKEVWDEVTKSIETTLKSFSLASLATRATQKRAGANNEVS